MHLYIHSYRGTPPPSSPPLPYPPTLNHLSRSLRCGRFLKKWGSWVRGDTLARLYVRGLDDAAESCSLPYSWAWHVLFGKSPVMYVCLCIRKHERWLCVSYSWTCSCAWHVLFGKSPVIYVFLYTFKHEWCICISSSWSYLRAWHVLFGKSPVVCVCIYICKYKRCICIASSLSCSCVCHACMVREISCYVYMYIHMYVRRMYIHVIGRLMYMICLFEKSAVIYKCTYTCWVRRTSNKITRLFLSK